MQIQTEELDMVDLKLELEKSSVEETLDPTD